MANAPGFRPAAMNIGTAERIGSAIAGAALLARTLGRPSLGRIIMAVGGAVLLQRGLTGHCALYQAFGIDTAELKGSNPRREPDVDPVDRASEDSFPASDPPAWTPVAGTAAKHPPATS